MARSAHAQWVSETPGTWRGSLWPRGHAFFYFNPALNVVRMTELSSPAGRYNYQVRPWTATMLLRWGRVSKVTWSEPPASDIARDGIMTAATVRQEIGLHYDVLSHAALTHKPHCEPHIESDRHMCHNTTMPVLGIIHGHHPPSPQKAVASTPWIHKRDNNTNQTLIFNTLP